MRYQLEVEINAPRERVVELFTDADTITEWQPDLVSFEQLRGEAREPGASTKQVHRMGKSDVETVETIMVADAPEHFAALYDSDSVWNLINNRFIDVGGRSTRWILESDCRCSSILQQIMIVLFRGSLKKQSIGMMNRFKAFAEDSLH